MAKHKDPAFKQLLWSLRKKRMRAPVWAVVRAKRRIVPRFINIHWRRTQLGHRARRMLE